MWNTEQAFLTTPCVKCAGGRRNGRAATSAIVARMFPLNLLCTPKAPRGCRILVFHGRPDPDEAIRGYRGAKIHHHIKAAPWIAEHWHA